MTKLNQQSFHDKRRFRGVIDCVKNCILQLQQQRGSFSTLYLTISNQLAKLQNTTLIWIHDLSPVDQDCLMNEATHFMKGLSHSLSAPLSAFAIRIAGPLRLHENLPAIQRGWAQVCPLFFYSLLDHRLPEPPTLEITPYVQAN